MILWCVSNYASLDGSGGLFASGRWHSKGRPVVYCAWNPATALLETLVHIEIDSEDRPERFQILKIEGRDTLLRERVEAAELPANWAGDISQSQRVGDQWLAERRSLLLEVPSALVPETWNVLVNPQHPDAARLRITAAIEHAFDVRLF